MKKDLTQGSVTKTMLLFAGPMILGNLLQQFYNIADTFIVGKFIGSNALAAVGSAYTLMTFLTSILIGMCMGCGSIFSNCFGGKRYGELKENIRVSFVMLGMIAIVMNVLVFLLLGPILHLLRVPVEIYDIMQEYVRVIFFGIFFVFLYNYSSFLLRALGNSFVPLCFLGMAAVLNIILDLVFVIGMKWGVEGAALATVIAQIFSGLGIGVYIWINKKEIFRELNASEFSEERFIENISKENTFSGEILINEKKKITGNISKQKKQQIENMDDIQYRDRIKKRFIFRANIGKRFKDKNRILYILRFSFASCLQQSVMNFGILMIQGLVNSFGAAVMAAFAAAVKIDTFAYMPAQEFGNAFSLFISQNHGAGDQKRVKQGMKNAIKISVAFCLIVSMIVYLLAPQLMSIFVDSSEMQIIEIGIGYLHIEGAFYWGIGLLFLLYGYYRGIGKPEMSLVLTIISLGTRVLIAYIIAPHVGVWGIWIAIPIGWVLADLTGLIYMRKFQKSKDGFYRTISE